MGRTKYVRLFTIVKMSIKIFGKRSQVSVSLSSIVEGLSYMLDAIKSILLANITPVLNKVAGNDYKC